MPGKIPTHRDPRLPHAGKAYDRSDGRREDHRFYASSAWRRLRASHLASDPLCAECRKAGRVTAGDQVHHVEERKDRPDLALDSSNLQTLCKPCHNATRRKQVVF